MPKIGPKKHIRHPDVPVSKGCAMTMCGVWPVDVCKVSDIVEDADCKLCSRAWNKFKRERTSL